MTTLIVAAVTLLPDARAGLIDHRSKESDEIEVMDNGEFARRLSVIELDGFLFTGNVIDCVGDNVDHWIVAFCPRWYSVCQKLLPIFQNVSRHWEEKVNSDVVMRSPVRFGFVDCAASKELCDEEGVEGYPTVVHYQNGYQMSQWTGYSMAQLKRLGTWVEKEINMGRKAPSPFDDVDPVRVSYVALAVFTIFYAWSIWIVVHGAGLLSWTSARPKKDGADLFSSARQEETPRGAFVASVKAAAADAPDVRPLTKAERCMPAEWVRSKATIELCRDIRV